MKPNLSIAPLLPICLLLPACAQEPERRPASVILISIDTLRADALGCYGYERDTSPVLDRFAAESARFEQAIVQSQGAFDGLGEDGLKASRLLQSMFKRQQRFSAEEIAHIRDLYDEGVTYMDEQSGRLFGLLKRHGLYEDALVIVTSDHGEQFQEHGGLIHYQYFDEMLRIPLLIHFPAFDGLPGHRPAHAARAAGAARRRVAPLPVSGRDPTGTVDPSSIQPGGS